MPSAATGLDHATRRARGWRFATRPSAMRDTAVTAAGDVWSGLRLLARLPRLVRRPVSQADAEAALRGRLERREADFLALVHRGVYENPASPCRRLLAHAGCQPGDLAQLVRAEGVEGALRTLLRAGVYLTVDELKGRCPIVRGSMSFVASPASFRNPGARADILTTSGGSRGPRTRVHQDLAFVWEGGSHGRHLELRLPHGRPHAVRLEAPRPES